MSRKKTVLVSVIAVLAVMLVFQIVLGKEKPYRAETLKSGSDPDEVEIVKSGGEKILIARKDGGWIIGDEGFPADSERIKALVDKISHVKVIDTVSRRGLYERYEVDEANRVAVTARQEGKVLRTLYIGKASATGRQNYILLDNSSNVLLVSGNYRRDYDRPADDFRDKLVYSGNPEEIVSISFSGMLKDDDGEFTRKAGPAVLVRDTEGWKTEGLSLRTGLSSEKIGSYVQLFASIRASDYRVPEAAFSEAPLYTVELKDRTGTFVLNIEQKTEDGFYICRASSLKYPFRLSSYNAERFMKGLSDFTE